jgi:acyl-CoA thioesterase FadM
MSRIIFDLPEHFGFSIELPVFFSHINMAGHLDNAQLLGLVAEARLHFFHTLCAIGTFPAHVVSDVVIQYISEVFYGETLRVDLVPADFNRYGFDLVFHAMKATGASAGREVARGKTGIVFIDKTSHRPTPIPEPLRQALLQREARAA